MKGVLLINLGSPDSTETKDVKRYLGEFLMDERVIDIAYWKRFLLIKGIILQVRPKKSGAAYKKIWWKEGSPLVVISERFSKKVSSKSAIPIVLAMSYGSMSMEKGFKALTDQGVDEILLVPLYPHYAMSSYETVTVKAEQIVTEHYPNVTMGWDASPRTLQSDVYKNHGYPFMYTIANNTPENFKKALEAAKSKLEESSIPTPFLTINAWNEWTEGSYLEPDKINGMKYLEAIRDVFKKTTR